MAERMAMLFPKDRMNKFDFLITELARLGNQISDKVKRLVMLDFIDDGGMFGLGRRTEPETRYIIRPPGSTKIADLEKKKKIKKIGKKYRKIHKTKARINSFGLSPEIVDIIYKFMALEKDSVTGTTNVDFLGY